MVQLFLQLQKTHLGGCFSNFLSLFNWSKYSRFLYSIYQANIYLLKVNDRDTRKRCEICSKLTIKSPEWRHWRYSVVFIVNFEYISHIFLVLLMLTWISNVIWVVTTKYLFRKILFHWYGVYLICLFQFQAVDLGHL